MHRGGCLELYYCNRNAFRSRLKCPNSMLGCCSEAGRLFQILGPVTEKLLLPRWKIVGTKIMMLILMLTDKYGNADGGITAVLCMCNENMQYNLYLWPNRRNFCILKEIRVEEHNGDVRFKSGSGNIAVSCMRNASNHNYANSSVIVDLAVGQIPCSTERISSLYLLSFCIRRI